MNLAEKSTAELVAIYNDKAFMLDRPPVKRFADRATAEKRVTQIINATNGVNGNAKKVEPATVESPTKVEQPKASNKQEENGVVRNGSYRDKLLCYLQRHIGAQLPVSELMKATYGEARKDFKGPLMMVLKGLRGVLAANRMGMEIRKTRENKENCFGLHKKN